MKNNYSSINFTNVYAFDSYEVLWAQHIYLDRYKYILAQIFKNTNIFFKEVQILCKLFPLNKNNFYSNGTNLSENMGTDIKIDTLKHTLNMFIIHKNI